MPLLAGEPRAAEPEFYITEATWMRKHGWRTPEWKLIHALEPDFHFKPEIELYNLIDDPEENHNLAAQEPEVVKFLEARMQAHIAKREEETGRTNPMYTNLNWNGHGETVHQLGGSLQYPVYRLPRHRQRLAGARVADPARGDKTVGGRVC